MLCAQRRSGKENSDERLQRAASVVDSSLSGNQKCRQRKESKCSPANLLSCRIALDSAELMGAILGLGVATEAGLDSGG